MHSLGLGAILLSALFHSSPSYTRPALVTPPSAAREGIADSSESIPALKRLAIPRSTERIKLTLVPPGDARVVTGEPIDPSVHGFARVEGATERGVQITYRDVDLGPSTCATDPIERELRRVWTATDVAGNTGTSTQTITILRRVASLDVRPGTCPNDYKVGSGGSLTVSLVGRADFDVRQVDLDSLELWTSGCTDGPVVPAQTKLVDDAAPYTNADGGCHTSRKDGRMDLALRFTTQQLASDLHLKSYPKSASVKLTLTGKLTSGATFTATDSMRLK